MKNLLLLLLICVSTAVNAQWKLKGTIEDTKTGKPLTGVTVTRTSGEKSRSIETNKRGRFTIKIQDSTDVITFEKEGYYPETMLVKNAKKVKVGLTKRMKKDNEEVYTDSYGSLNTDRVTSAISILKTKDFNRGVSTDIYELLRGKVPGLMIRRNAANPNAEPSVMLRSSGTASRVIEPLILVDGVNNPSLSNVDPNDVESIQVLRDGSAAAMYGSTAAGGVIIITTKKGTDK